MRDHGNMKKKKTFKMLASIAGHFSKFLPIHSLTSIEADLILNLSSSKHLMVILQIKLCGIT